MQRVAVQGNPGSYAHVAAQAVAPGAEVSFHESFQAAVQAAENGQAEGAIIPIENSSMGRIAEIHALLPATRLHIAAEHYLPIQHALMARKGTTLHSIKTAHSQLPALIQCQNTLKHLGLTPVQTLDTALAAKELAAHGDATQAAVASHLAAEIYDLEILVPRLNDHAHNTTRFVLLTHTPVTPEATVPCKMSLLFRVRDQAGALYQALAGFAENGVNLTKLESYIDTDQGTFALAEFYVEIEGHPATPPVAKALAALQTATVWVRIMGTYPQAPRA